MPCFIRQALETARLVLADKADHERIVREVMGWAARMDLSQSPPRMAQRIHRRLCELTGDKDPYRAAKDHQNQMALKLLPELRDQVRQSGDALMTALRLSIAGNIIDMGVNGHVTETQVRVSIDRALSERLVGDIAVLRHALENAAHILYLTDNAGEIVFDRLLVEEIGPQRVTVAVRGAPILNDATCADARAVGLVDMVTVIDNGSDAPGTLLEDCSPTFKKQFASSDLILAKGQGNFESLSDEAAPVIFLFQAKCPVIASHAQVPQGSHVLTWFHPEMFKLPAVQS